MKVQLCQDEWVKEYGWSKVPGKEEIDLGALAGPTISAYICAHMCNLLGGNGDLVWFAPLPGNPTMYVERRFTDGRADTPGMTLWRMRTVS